MASIKALLTGLVGVSLCMANISGTVTDTGITPISGAVVQLENGGQTATTGADGNFTLVASAAIIPVNGKLLPNGLSARISGTLLNVTIAERAVVEVATFDLNGKALSTVRQSMDAGTHSIALPQRGAGVYLYKVKLGNREFVLKGNSVGGVSSGSAILSEGPSSNYLAKQAKTTAAINDVIAATKTGYLNYRVVVGNSDTSGIAIKMIASAGTVTDVDGNVYQTVGIGNQVWMAENLRVTKYNDGSLIPDFPIGPWYGDVTTPMYCFYNNANNSDSARKYGALYDWYAVNPVNPKKIAPTGWHVPSFAEWDTLQNSIMPYGTTNNIAKILAAKTDWLSFCNQTKNSPGCNLTTNNSSGFSALPSGCRDGFGEFLVQDTTCYWWSTSESDSAWARVRSLEAGGYDLRKYVAPKGQGNSVRLVSDN